MKLAIHNQFVPFSGNGVFGAFISADSLAPAHRIKTATGSTEMTSKGVRRVMLKVECPFVDSIDGVTGVPDVRTVSGHFVLNVPSKTSPQFVPAALAGQSQVDAIEYVLRGLYAAVYNRSVFLPPAAAFDFSIEGSAVGRGLNGITPFEESADYGNDPS